MTEVVRASLFRPEVLSERTARLHGEVRLYTPLAWQVVGLLLFLALFAATLFLAFASYTRVALANGEIVLDKGVASIIPSRSGIVSRVEVEEGQQVRAGQALLRVRSEEEMLEGNTASARLRTSVDEQSSRLFAQGDLLMTAAKADQSRLREQIKGLSGEVESITAQISDQRRLVDVASADLANAREVAANGFISKRDLDERQATLISRRQQLAQFEQLRSSKLAAIGEDRRAVAQASASARSQLAATQSQRAGLSQLLTAADAARGYTMTSPVDGFVTALTARSGSPADPQQPLMLVVPTKALPSIQLYVPTTAAAFVARGQEVRVAIDAFPYQRFGTLTARISNVASATVAKQGQGGSVPVYLVTATLPEPWIMAFGRRQRLLSGMTLTARIVTERRSLLEWLFEPVFAVRNR